MTHLDDDVFDDLTKVTVHLTKPSMSALYGLSAEMGLSRTDCINRALGLYAAVVQVRVGQAISFDHPGHDARRVFVRLRDRKPGRRGRWPWRWRS